MWGKRGGIGRRGGVERGLEGGVNVIRARVGVA